MIDHTIDRIIPPGVTEMVSGLEDFDQLAMTHAERYHKRGIYGQGVTVAVIDSGVFPHEDLRGKLLEGTSFVDGQPWRQDDVAHGSHVAGLIAGEKSGIAPGVQVLPVKIFDQNGYAHSAYAAVRWALGWRHPVTGKPVDVINLSLTGTDGEGWQKLMDECRAAGVTVVCAAGNYGNDGRDRYPATLDYPVVVGAVDRARLVTDFSSRITEMDVCQLGHMVWSCSNGQHYDYYCKSGTSMSTPIVAGMLALYKAEDTTRTDADLYRCLMDEIADLGAQGKDDLYGYGMPSMADKAAPIPPSTKAVTYSLKADGGKALAANFKVREFACKDGSDTVLIAPALVDICQRIRDHFGKAITVVSGYRSPAYNARINGAKHSLHITGQAADLKVAGVDPLTVALYAQSLEVPGIGLYSYGGGSGFTHVDVRSGRWRGLQVTSSGSSQSLTAYMPTVRRGDRGNVVTLMQRLLKVGADGVFGAGTDGAVKTYQAKKRLTSDGICGPKTWDKLTEE